MLGHESTVRISVMVGMILNNFSSVFFAHTEGPSPKTNYSQKRQATKNAYDDGNNLQ